MTTARARHLPPALGALVLCLSPMVTPASGRPIVVAGSDPAAAPAPVAPTAGPRAVPAPAASVAPAPPAAEPGDCPEPDQIVRALQARYDTTRTLRATFRQRTIVAAFGEGEESQGTVAFKKPGMMRWDYAAPVEQRIIADGTHMWIYQPREQQVLRARFRAAFVSTTPVSFLVGVGRLTDDFEARPDPRGCDPTALHVALEPRGDTALGTVAFAVDRATYDILGVSVTDPLGNVTRLEFGDLERNVAIADGRFRFEVPPGVDVITAPGAAP